ncbi:MAG: hypothetical protein BWK78_05745, partial [Thiotrichaceae bacterium IS1]
TLVGDICMFTKYGSTKRADEQSVREREKFPVEWAGGGGLVRWFKKCAETVSGHKPWVRAVALALMAVPTISYAVPASPKEFTLIQPPEIGISFQARQWGDEFHHGIETADGYTIIQEETTGIWTYAMTDPDGYVVPSPLIVGADFDLAVQYLPKGVQPEGLALQQVIQQTAALQMGPGINIQLATPTTGTVKVPVILVNFKDTTTQFSTSNFDNLLFTGSKSMNAYYKEVSYSKLNITGQVKGWYTATQAHDYYGCQYNPFLGICTNSATWRVLAIEAVQAADTTVNFADYDNDKDCVVDGVIIVHQGAGMEASGNDNDIWSHKWSISYLTNDTGPKAGGGTCQIKVSTYSMQPEKLYSGLSTMGVFAHEFGHILGLPDLYDTDNTRSQGIGNWDLMASGSWNGTIAGDTPAHLSAWSKLALGWVTPAKVTGLLTAESIDQVSLTGDVYQFLTGSPTAGGEYFLVENRNRTGFDAGLPASGLAIWHIDESKKTTNNTDNTNECSPASPTFSNCATTHYRVALVQADKLWELEIPNGIDRGDSGDVFPGGTTNKLFEDATDPSAKLYSGANSKIHVKSISGSGTTMTATLCYGDQPSISVTPTPLNFGIVNVSSPSAQPLTISNTGCVDLQLQTANTNSAFKVLNLGTCATLLASGKTCTFNVTFTPTSAGAVSDTLSIKHSGTSLSSVTLSGTGNVPNVPKIEVREYLKGNAGNIISSIDFENLLTNQFGDRPIIIKNAGTAPLTIDSLSFTGLQNTEFKEYTPVGFWTPDRGFCKFAKTLQPGRLCVQYVQVIPTSASPSARTATLAISSNDPNTPVSSVALKATVTTSPPPPNLADYDVACNLTPTLVSNGLGSWAKIDTGTNGYTIPDVFVKVDTNNPPNPKIPLEKQVPGPDDVVLIKSGHFITGIPFARVKALCNKGTLQAKKESSLEIHAGKEEGGVVKGGISNHGTIKTSTILPPACGVGYSLILKSGVSTTTGQKPEGDQGGVAFAGKGVPFYNKGTIEAGNGVGGDCATVAGNGGDVFILAKNTLNEGTIKAGKGGDNTTATGGKGGVTSVWGRWSGDGTLFNTATGVIQSGNGGQGCSGGNGGDLWLVSEPNVFLYGTHKAGIKGSLLASCSKPQPRDGELTVEPSVIAVGADATLEGGDITIFGGEDWILDLSNANRTLVKSTGNITLQVGKNSIVNLMGNKVPVLEAVGKVTILSDVVLLDEGVQLSDIIDAAEIVTGPSKIRYEVLVVGASKTIGLPNTTLPVDITVTNSGPMADTYDLSVSDSAGWPIGMIEPSITLEGLNVASLGLNVTLPPTLGEVDTITVTATSHTDPSVTSIAEIVIEVTDGKEDEVTDIMPPAIAYNASGYLLDNGKPIVGVMVKAGDTTGMTDDQGFWMITGLKAGSYTVTAEKEGYIFSTENFTVGEGKNATVNIKVTPVGDRTAHGTLRDDQGNPIAGVTLEIDGKTAT